MDIPTRGKVSVALGAAGLLIAIWGLWKDVGPIAQPFYAYAWWSYILVLDGVVALRQGGSLLTTGRRHFFPIFLWSITFWFFFELLNLRYQNWYYVGVFAAEQASDLLVGGLFAIACFSTVFFGLFETYEVLTAFSFARPMRAEPRELPGWVSYAIQGGGLVLIALSLLFSHYLAPLVWGSLTFLIDPWNYRRGARSVLWELSQGNWGLLLRLLVSGLLCGIVWESSNFYAPQKWIYTVRGLEELKLFEMPVLGFLGFPALAADGLRCLCRPILSVPRQRDVGNFEGSVSTPREPDSMELLTIRRNTTSAHHVLGNGHVFFSDGERWLRRARARGSHDTPLVARRSCASRRHSTAETAPQRRSRSRSKSQTPASARTR